jgi:DNA-binding PadR family transcriptional regulator
MPLSHALLALAKEHPRYPYAIKTAFEEVFGDFWPLNYGQVHQSLEALTHKGLLRVRPDPEDNARRVYEITAAGEAELAAWLRSVDVKIRPLRDDLYLRIYLQQRDPDVDLLPIVEEHRLAYARHLRTLTRKRAAHHGDDPASASVEQLLLDAAIEHTEAEIRWLDRVRAHLQSSRKPRRRASQR